jgi:hypothetical protein
MDDRVIRSMARWPDVPAVFGWLALDARGRWLLKGETIANRAAVAFIARNYGHDELGRWYFQNGPQRVFVDLHATPWVFRLQPDGRLVNHIEDPVVSVTAVVIDDSGAVSLDTPAGVGRLDDRDLELFARRLCDRDGEPLDDDAVLERVDALAAGKAAQLTARIGAAVLPLSFVPMGSMPARFHFVREPRATDSELE